MVLGSDELSHARLGHHAETRQRLMCLVDPKSTTSPIEIASFEAACGRLLNYQRSGLGASPESFHRSSLMKP
jgi:hypothetical protein